MTLHVTDWHLRQSLRQFKLVAKQQRTLSHRGKLAAMRHDYDLALMHLGFAQQLAEPLGLIGKPYWSLRAREIAEARSEADARVTNQMEVVRKWDEQQRERARATRPAPKIAR